MVSIRARPLVGRRKGRAVERMITRDSAAGAMATRRDPAPGPADVDSEVERATIAVQEASRELRQRLDDYDGVILENLEKFRSGMRVRDVVRTMPTADATIGSEVEVIDMFEARRRLRRAIVAALLADGMPVDEIASTFKVSIESICDFATQIGRPTQRSA
jgi:hypothetical protein